MKGKISVTVANKAIRYKFELRRNITIIKGDSATGKTTLVDMIRDFEENGISSGISLQCEYPCVVLEGRQWKVLLENTHESVVFIDEGNQFVASDEFASSLKGSDNYFVIVSREHLPNLPYSIEEIYGIKSSGKYGRLQQTYQEFYRIYGDYQFGKKFDPDVILTDDSNSGFEFFDAYSVSQKWSAESAGGKSNVFHKIKCFQDKKLLVIADGAAFGPEMERVIQKIESTEEIALYLPESFEWLILKSDLLADNEIQEIIENPSQYIDSKDFMSWERFFTALTIEKTKNTYLHYSKSKLNEAYKNPKVQDKIIKQIPDGLL